jgi:hypothetical protein
MTNSTGPVTKVKNNAAYNPEMRHVTLSSVDPNDRTLDIGIDITGFIISVVIKDSNLVTIDTFTTADGSITITNAAEGYFKPLKADISNWVAGEIYQTDVKLTDVGGDGLNDATSTMFIEVLQGIS